MKNMGKTSTTKKKKTPIIRIIFLYVTRKVGLSVRISNNYAQYDTDSSGNVGRHLGSDRWFQQRDENY